MAAWRSGSPHRYFPHCNACSTCAPHRVSFLSHQHPGHPHHFHSQEETSSAPNASSPNRCSSPNIPTAGFDANWKSRARGAVLQSGDDGTKEGAVKRSSINGHRLGQCEGPLLAFHKLGDGGVRQSLPSWFSRLKLCNYSTVAYQIRKHYSTTDCISQENAELAPRRKK